MWLGPALFVTISVLLWKYLGAVFMPELLARSIYRMLPSLESVDLFIFINAGIVYFGLYIVVAIFWRRLKPYVKSPFLAGLGMSLGNLLIIRRLLGRARFG